MKCTKTILFKQPKSFQGRIESYTQYTTRPIIFYPCLFTCPSIASGIRVQLNTSILLLFWYVHYQVSKWPISPVLSSHFNHLKLTCFIKKHCCLSTSKNRQYEQLSTLQFKPQNCDSRINTVVIFLNMFLP